MFVLVQMYTPSSSLSTVMSQDAECVLFELQHACHEAGLGGWEGDERKVGVFV